MEAVFHQQRDAARVVDVRVGDEQDVDAAGGKGEVAVVKLIAPLLQAAIDEELFSVDLQAVARAGHAAVGAVKVQFHFVSSLRMLLPESHGGPVPPERYAGIGHRYFTTASRQSASRM